MIPPPNDPEEVKRAFDEALQRGDPIALLAAQLAQGQAGAKLVGEPLSTPIADDSLYAYTGGAIPVEPDYVVFDDGTPLNIQTTTVMGEIVLGERMPERIVKLWCEVGDVTCRCGDTQDKKGWLLEKQDYYPNKIVQCSNCQSYMWIYPQKGKNDE